jgi:malate synthase
MLSRGKTPLFYVPKCEHYLEASWWNQLFSLVESQFDLPRGSLKVTLLIETLPAAFQIEEILYELRERCVGLNGGRWDKIFSDIKILRHHPDRIMSDRSAIDMSKSWMDNYAKRLIKICHMHGAFAMGGMSAFTPGKDPETRERQLEKVRQDKAREAAIGHDGCWVSHPYFIGMAREQFKKKNQLDVLLYDFPKKPDLLPQSQGPKSLHGLRTNIRVGIAYQYGWDQDIGCVAWDGLMEDLATLEISRAQTWQWLHHGVRLDDGTLVTRELVARIFDEECERILRDLTTELEATGNRKLIEKTKADYLVAKDEAKSLFLQDELAEFFTLSSHVAVGASNKSNHMS